MGMTAVWAQMEREVTGDRVADNLYLLNVETSRLVRDERGWLRLAG